MLISFHTSNTELVFIIGAAHLYNVFVLGVLCNNQCMRFTTTQLFAFDVFDGCKTEYAFTVPDAKLPFGPVSGHVERLIFTQDT